MTEFEKQVDDYIKSDRQWPKEHRINHAKWQMLKLGPENRDKPQTLYAINFWRAVLARNEG